MYTRWGGFVDGIDRFDPGFFGFSPREALRIDPQHRMLLEVAWESLEDAGLPVDRLAGSPDGRLRRHLHPRLRRPAGVPAEPRADRQPHQLGRRGEHRRQPHLVRLRLPRARASSWTPRARRRWWRCTWPARACAAASATLALAGGVQAVLNPELTIGFCKASMISPDGRCRAFSAEANGYVRGEGAGLIVLKPLSRALADGDRIYALVRGSAINEDGRTNGMTVPGLPAQQQVLRDAYAHAGVASGRRALRRGARARALRSAIPSRRRRSPPSWPAIVPRARCCASAPSRPTSGTWRRDRASRGSSRPRWCVQAPAHPAQPALPQPEPRDPLRRATGCA